MYFYLKYNKIIIEIYVNDPICCGGSLAMFMLKILY